MFGFGFPYNTINPLTDGVAFDPDAEAFITASGISGSNATSINNLVINLKAAGLWTKMKAIYPFIGGTASTHKWNLKDPRDLDAAFRLSFVGGWTHSTTGATPNGTNGYANTFLSKTNLTELNTHISYYSRSNIVNLPAIEMGIFGSGSNTFNMLISFSGVFYLDMYDFNTNRVFINNSDSRGFYLGSRISSTSLKAYKNGIQFSSTNTNTSTGWAALNGNMTIGNRNDLPAGNYTNKECAFSSIGDGLTDLEAQIFNQIVEGYQFSLGRNINPAQSFYYNPSYNNETNAFLYSTQVTDPVTQGAVNTLVNDMKADGIWTKMKAIYPICGGSASSHAVNLKTPGTYNLTFATGVTHSSTGMTGNGSSGYANTSLNPLSVLSSNIHLSFYSRTQSVNTQVEIGIFLPTPDRIVQLRASSNYLSGNTTSSINFTTTTDARGFWIGTKRSNNDREVYLNNNSQATNTTSDTTIMPNTNLFLLGRNNNGSLDLPSTKQCAFASIGDGLTDTDAANLYTRVQSFQTTLGRQV